MGVTIRCKKTGLSIDMGYGGFGNLRNKVAELYSEEFGNHYKLIPSSSVMFLEGERRKSYFEEYDRKTEEMIQSKRLNIKVADFCYQSDCGGVIRYGACKIIYNTVKNYDDDLLYGYAGRSDCAKFSDFKNLLKECCDTKSDLIWS